MPNFSMFKKYRMIHGIKSLMKVKENLQSAFLPSVIMAEEI
jgi:hypothetical protein